MKLKFDSEDKTSMDPIEIEPLTPVLKEIVIENKDQLAYDYMNE
jgi:hypothetical protein